MPSRGSRNGSEWTADAVIAGAPEPIIVADRGGRIVRANTAAARLLGLRERDLIHRPLSRFLRPDETGGLAVTLEPVANQQTVHDIPATVVGRDRDRARVLLSASALRDASGRVVGLIACLRHPPEAGDEQAALKRRARELEQTIAERSEDLRLATKAKDEFLAVLSHELRTPLTPILTWAQIIRREPDPQRIRQGTEVIERNVRLQIALVEDLLDLARVTDGTLALDRRREDLRVVVQASIDTVAEAALQKQMRLEWLPPPAPVIVDGDAARIGQALRHVVSNAVKFGRADGSIQLTLSRDGDGAVIQVRDDGAGIQAEFLPFVFDLFRQQEEGARRQYGGLGVGLTLAKFLVELHGGSTTVESGGPALGTVVTVRLPLAGAGGGRPYATDQPAFARLDGVRVLLVEDSADAGDATCVLLEDLGARVTLAKNGLEALDVLANEAEPDAILCDLRMPGLDGFELLRRLRSEPRWAHLGVVAVSGFARWTDFQRTREAGFDGHVSKPFDTPTLLAALRQVLDRGQPAA
jgi:PAS domain S-box-containing protein